MVTIRRLLRDRRRGGALAVLLAYALALQALLGAVASGTMAAAPADSLHVLCLPSQGADPDGPAAPDPGHDCPCATLCRLAGLAMPALPGLAQALAPPPAATLATGFAHEHFRAPPPRGLIPEARGPPLSV